MGKDDNWMKDSVCAHPRVNPEIFFLKRGAQKENVAKIVLAKKLCKVCPVRLECLKFAIAHNVRDGIWGGMTVHERKRYFPKSVRIRLTNHWFRNHPGAEPMYPMSEYTPRSRRGGQPIDPHEEEVWDDSYLEEVGKEVS